MNRKSPTCKARKSGRPLTEYETKAEAKSAANYANKNFSGENLVPYKCDRCGFWHISPTGRQTPSKACTICRGADGMLKESYQSENDAQLRAGILHEEQGVTLYIYECEHGNGWHLTKNQY
ncbi:hypothetical protein HQ531_01955 [bacterium]|nr:hypothetical protein [bacterium]